MVFVLISDDMKESMNYGQYLSEGIRIVNKLKKDQLLEAVARMEDFGWTEGHVYNIGKNVWKDGSEHHFRITSWYLFKEDGKWFYKQSKTTKAFHEVEGVA